MADIAKRQARRQRSNPVSRLAGASAARLRDVAMLAGVSTATVSRAMNSPEKVSEEMVRRVKIAADTLDYVPDSAAKALRSRRTRIIGTVIPTLRHAIYARQVEALQHELKSHGYMLLVTTSDYSLAAELEQTGLLIERGIEGLVLVGEKHDPNLYGLLASRRVEFVSTYWYNARSAHPCVGFDNRRVAGKAAEYLMDLGHTEFTMLSGITEDNDRASERLEGVRLALRSRGLLLSPEAVVEKPYMISAGREGFRTLLARGVQPTAVICGSDVLAFGVLAECASVGIEIPKQLSVIGFDNLEFAAHLQPALTTIEVPADEMGRCAGDYLMRRLKGERAELIRELEANLISRGTTAPPPGRP